LVLKKKHFYILLVLLAILALSVIFLFTLPFIKSNKINDSSYKSQEVGFFEIKKVEIEGDTPFVSHANIQKILMKHVKSNFFDINLDNTIIALDALPGVKSTSIRRVWPDKLVVNLHSEIAFAKSSKQNWLINPKGELFETQIPVEAALPVFQAPVGKIPDVIGFYNKIKPKFRDDFLYISQIDLLDTGDWNVYVNPLNNNYLKAPKPFVIQLGHRFLEKRVDDVLQVYKSGKLNTNKYGPKVVSLQYQNGFSVQWYG
jgi:cell division protein FtsQ